MWHILLWGLLAFPVWSEFEPLGKNEKVVLTELNSESCATCAKCAKSDVREPRKSDQCATEMREVREVREQSARHTRCWHGLRLRQRR